MTAPDDASTPPRLVASLGGETPGPTLIVIGGLHGNEPSGVAAMRSVALALAREPLPLRGDLTMLAGNVAALERGVRFVDHDLNRGWTDERLATLRAAAPGALDAEDREQMALADALDRALDTARGPAYLLDLHATSAEGIPFSLCRDVPAARRFAGAFPVTLVLGLLESLSGTLAGWVGARCTAAVVEGGQNSDPATARNQEAVIWLSLVAAGLVVERDVPSLTAWRETLTRTRGDLPPVLQVHHRHAIVPDDRFLMEPGFANIQRVAANELLACDRVGEIRAPGAGFVLLPLYQATGDDGFFLGREAEGTKAS
jgi:succinylglutamate desuccinylase